MRLMSRRVISLLRIGLGDFGTMVTRDLLPVDIFEGDNNSNGNFDTWLCILSAHSINLLIG